MSLLEHQIAASTLGKSPAQQQALKAPKNLYESNRKLGVHSQKVLYSWVRILPVAGIVA
jgi:hypothetical protein